MPNDPNLLDEEPFIPLDEDPYIPLEEPAAPQSVVPPDDRAGTHAETMFREQQDVASAEPEALSPALNSPAAPMGLMHVLPANFQLPKLIRFIPDQRLKAAADDATKYLLAVEVSGPDGIAKADVALTAVRMANAAIVESFREPAQLANDVHKSITGKRAEWLAPGEHAISVVGRRVASEQLRLQRLAEEARRKAQEEEDRKARERARKEAEEAAKRNAPKAVVAQMREQAEKATAPPVRSTIEEPPKLTGQTVVRPWKARLVGTPAEAEPNPSVADLTPAQLQEVMVLLRAIIEGRAPVTAIELSWSVLNQRAKSDKQTLNIPGIEAFEDPGIRAKSSRGRK